ncbi:metallophosphoesterase [Candidatus Woesearchaeota archaeon]|nr:metallophosphoesterase [Candidatus Woesearchaeota archaeon]
MKESNSKKGSNFKESIQNNLQKEIIVVGDVELGAGNLTDDFIADKAFSEFINSLTKRKHPITLVCNGDTFDFLKCPFKDSQDQLTYPRHITSEISINKLHLIAKAHERVFTAWKKFVKKKKNELYFIIGNHDHDIFFKEVQEEIKRLLENKKQVHFPGLRYNQHEVYIEHGHQYDFLNRINFRNIFLDYNQKKILNFPWASFGLMSSFMDLKEEHPFMERIVPRQLMLSLHGMVLRKVNLLSLGYFLKSLLYHPFRYYSDPTYNLPTKLFGEFYNRLKSRHWDVDEMIDIFRKKKKHRKDRIFVLGHVHEVSIIRKRKKVILRPGTWRDEYLLNSKNRTLTPIEKYYVQIKVEQDEELSYDVLSYPTKRSVFLFDDVRKHEYAYMHLAAQEEGYRPVYY